MRIEKPKRHSNSAADSKLLTGDVTTDSYAGRCEAFIRACGGNGYVIRAIEGERGSSATGEPATEPQWLAWMSYFAAKGVPMRFTASFGLRTVPCEWPEEFDYSWPASDRYARLLPPAPPASAMQRDRVGRLMAGLVARLASTEPRAGAFDRRRLARTPDQRLADLRDEFTATPCAPLSGLGRIEGAA